MAEEKCQECEVVAEAAVGLKEEEVDVEVVLTVVGAVAMALTAEVEAMGMMDRSRPQRLGVSFALCKGQPFTNFQQQTRWFL
jgi:hypothetical protein